MFMKKKAILILLSLIFAGGLSFFQYQYFERLAAGDKKIQVLAAVSDIKAGEKIDAKLGIKVIPQSAYIKEMYLANEKAAGYAKVDISAGSYVLKSMVAQEKVPVLKDGMRRVTIGVNLTSSLAGKIKPGDVVDIGWVPKDEAKDGTSKIIVEKVKIYDAVSKSGEDVRKADKNNQYDKESLIPAAVTVIVSPHDGVLLKEYENKGDLFLIGY